MASLSRRTEAQSAKRAQVEASLLRATEALLTEGATFAELGVERIARKAGISRTAFYFYFRDKRDLLMRLVDGVADQIYAEAEAWWRGDEGEDVLAAALERAVGLWRAHGLLLRAVVESAAYDPEVGAFWRDLMERFVAATRERIASEQAAGRTPADLDAQGVAFALIWGAERTCYQQLVAGEEPSADALIPIWRRTIYGR